MPLTVVRSDGPVSRDDSALMESEVCSERLGSANSRAAVQADDLAEQESQSGAWQVPA